MTMRNLSKAMMTAAAALLASGAVAAEAPKEGSFAGKAVVAGKMTARVAAGSPMAKAGEAGVSFGVAMEEQGVVSYEGAFPLPARTRCVGMIQVVKGVAQSVEYCVDTDADGDQMLAKSTGEPWRWGTATLRFAREVLAGTGKYEGIVATGTVDCQSAPKGGGFENNCEGHGTYKLP